MYTQLIVGSMVRETSQFAEARPHVLRGCHVYGVRNIEERRMHMGKGWKFFGALVLTLAWALPVHAEGKDKLLLIDSFHR